MAATRKTLTSAEAAEYTASLERRAEALGVELDHWVLGVGKPNDIRMGSGPRYAIVSFAQESARRGATYGQVLGSTVIQGNGDRYRIRTSDLAGFVCANGYCTISPPSQKGASPILVDKQTPAQKANPSPAGWEPAASKPRSIPSPLPEAFLGKVDRSPGPEPCSSLLETLLPAYRCSCFDGVCATMRWDPPAGHIPRGFLGATGTPSEVELVLVFAEPGDPQPGDHTTMEEALGHAYWAFSEGTGQFHRNARTLFQLCWPGLPFEQQLRRVWMTESVLCSALITTGSVPKSIEQECAKRYLKPQLALFPNALVVGLGSKAQQRLDRIGVAHLKAHAIAPPGCNQKEAYPSWVRVAETLKARDGERLRSGLPRAEKD